ncbi:DHBP synthase RibB-like alpha/beta domain-containing protein [Cynara cardunculus var. scolymus]|uniref:Threonylcarbamoyl-AMP synthase n=1 Tax=Cynara cardunculus var. scolymus TaxID=59895 RepID=A0A103YHK4_CYNCS|nr:DHBP synthase RibB-like alpha/beta domain-containing protein [Cynara cardunculus var. scolymus]
MIFLHFSWEKTPLFGIVAMVLGICLFRRNFEFSFSEGFLPIFGNIRLGSLLINTSSCVPTMGFATALQMKPYGCAAAASISFRRSVSPFSTRLPFQPSPKVSRLKVSAVVKKSPKRLKYASPRLPKEDGLLYVEVDPNGEDTWKLDSIVELLKEGAVGVIPTDTVYAMVCDMNNHDAIQRLRRLKDPFSILCRSLHDIDTYTTGFPRGNSDGLSDIFRAVKHCLPGAYTFILTASKALPKQCIKYGTTSSKYATRKSLGVRIPDDIVCQAVLEKMGAPLFSTSVRSPQENRWIIDPVLIADTYRQEGLNFVIDAGVRVANPSTGPKQPWMAEDDDAAAAEERESI